mmetsp:Transcript_2553/g.3650  ORF Transcript_2553/g.3650 Transcript_2553/m.3650 type:complete len:289 (+) Transcript_2553:180-1046(+)
MEVLRRALETTWGALFGTGGQGQDGTSEDCVGVNFEARGNHAKRDGKKRKREEKGGEGKGTKAQQQGSSKKKKKGKKKLKLGYLDKPGDEEWFNDPNHEPKLLVFDLNGVVVSRCKQSKIDGDNANFRDPIGQYVYERPHVRELINWAVKKRGYRVACWTSATPKVAFAIADRIFDSKIGPPEFVFSQNECKRRSDPLASRAILTKPLWVVFEKHKKWKPSNTIIIDNSMEKTQFDMDNVVHVRTFDKTIGVPDDDEFGDGGLLWSYLDGLSRHRGDVREYLNKHPFG